MLEPHRQSLFDLDPLFAKALKLMHSKSPTSADELMKLFEESLNNKKLETKNSKNDSIVSKNLENKKREQIEKLYIDKAKQELKELSECQIRRQNSNSNSPTKNKDLDLLNTDNNSTLRKKHRISSDSDTELSDNDKSNNELEDLKLQLDIGSLSCVVCKSLSQTPTNRLVECQDCHGLYHQECHKPPITENVNDPRFVWYCFKCSKNLKKIATKPSVKKMKTSPTTSTTTMRNSPLLFTKSSMTQSPSTSMASTSSTTLLQQPFKRIEQPIKPIVPKDPSSISSSSRGLAGLAANLAANKDVSGFKSKHLDSGKPLMKLGKIGPDNKATSRENSNSSNSNSSNHGNSSKQHNTSDNKISTSQKSVTKLSSNTFSSAISASASTSSMTFSGSLARLNAETTSGFKKVSSSKQLDKR